MLWIVLRLVIFTLFMQIYIVSGGQDSSNTGLASTETLEKDGRQDGHTVAWDWTMDGS